MRIFVILLLILNFSSCGKIKNESGAWEYQKPKYSDDADGDLIKNSNDKEPYIADFPNPTIKAHTLLITNGKEVGLTFSKRSLDYSSFYTNIFNNINQRNLKYILPDISFYDSNPIHIRTKQGNSVVRQSIVSNSLADNLELSYYSKKVFLRNIIDNTRDHLIPNSLLSTKLSMKVENYTFYKNDKSYRFKQLLNSVQGATYSLRIFDGKKIRQLYISKHLSLKIALTLISKDLELDQHNRIQFFLGKKHFSRTDSYNLLDNDTGFWVIFNKTNQNLNYIPQEGEIIHLAYIKKKNLLKYAHPNKEYKKVIKKLSHKIPLRKISKGNIKISGSLTMNYNKIKKYNHTWTTVRNGHTSTSTVRLSCKVRTRKLKTKKIRLHSKNVDKYLEFYINNEKFTFIDLNLYLNNLNQELTNDDSIIIKYKEKLKPVLYGIYKTNCPSSEKKVKIKKAPMLKLPQINFLLQSLNLSN